MDSISSQDNSLVHGAPSVIAGVAFPIAIPGIYDYRVPVALQNAIGPGSPVLVPLKNRKIWGVVIEIRATSRFPELKEILETKIDRWTDSNNSLITLYQWIAAYYQCDLGRVFKPLVSQNLLKANAKTQLTYSVNESGTASLSEKQRNALTLLKTAKKPLTAGEILLNFNITAAIVSALHKKGHLTCNEKTILREAIELSRSTFHTPVTLSTEQQESVRIMMAAMAKPDKPYLLHGITGSGKTHVYTELAKQALTDGKGVIILVPEISLTPQTIARFRSAIGDCISVIHSHMSNGERRDSLEQLVTGAKRVVIGVRSAILAPIDNVGLIIVDEEHDGSYKQSDTDPRFHARDVAIMRGHFQKALVVLGSATPGIETYQNALAGKYHLLQLKQRFGEARLPLVSIVDMNEEHRRNNWTILSGTLEASMRECLERKRQIILLLNRRGFSTVLLCKDCGYTYMCPHCSVALKYHRSDATLKCHLCGFEDHAPDVCPTCRGQQIKYNGTGIQKAEEAIREKFPKATIIRMDRDTTRHKGAHGEILDQFAQGQAEILIGTQMVAKGLNFPGVALVGVLQADTGLLVPDFRASERTFQLLTQVAGRAGRTDGAGEVVVQTYYPDDPAIKAAQMHDYENFFAREVIGRKELSYPPFSKIARVVLVGKEDTSVKNAMHTLARIALNAAPEIIALGPSPAVFAKIQNEFRYSLLLKSTSPKKLSSTLSAMRLLERKLPQKMRLIIDVDPQYML